LTDYAAQYWLKPPSRRELQKALDEYTAVLVQLQERQIKLDLTISYLADKIGVTPAEFQSYMQQKMEEFVAAQEASKVQAETPAETPRVTLN